MDTEVPNLQYFPIRVGREAFSSLGWVPSRLALHAAGLGLTGRDRGEARAGDSSQGECCYFKGRVPSVYGPNWC
jgi:hypothetical protein